MQLNDDCMRSGCTRIGSVKQVERWHQQHVLQKDVRFGRAPSIVVFQGTVGWYATAFI